MNPDVLTKVAPDLVYLVDIVARGNTKPDALERAAGVLLERIYAAELPLHYRTMEEIRTGTDAPALVIHTLSLVDLVRAGFWAVNHDTLRSNLEQPHDALLVRRFQRFYEFIGIPDDADDFVSSRKGLHVAIPVNQVVKKLWPWMGDEWDGFTDAELSDTIDVMNSLVNMHGVTTVFDLPQVTPVNLTWEP